MNPPKASILIPVYNRCEDLLQLLQDLLSQDHDNFEVIVIDDGSNPTVQDFLQGKQFPYPLEIIRQPKNRGIGAARNRALAAAHGQLLIWIDSDVRILDPNWLTGHIKTHDQGIHLHGSSVPSPFLLHSRVQGGTPTHAGRTFAYSNWFMSCQRKPYIAETHHLPTNNTSAPRSVFDKVGNFDDSLQVAEDIDWCMRARAQGIPLIYVPDYPVQHRDPARWAEVWSSYLKMGAYVRVVRTRHPNASYSWLYPEKPWQNAIMLLPRAIAITLYATYCWLPHSPAVLLYIPGQLLANLAYSLGFSYPNLGRKQNTRI